MKGRATAMPAGANASQIGIFTFPKKMSANNASVMAMSRKVIPVILQDLENE
jgi:hypothetical protein